MQGFPILIQPAEQRNTGHHRETCQKRACMLSTPKYGLKISLQPDYSLDQNMPTRGTVLLI